MAWARPPPPSTWRTCRPPAAPSTLLWDLDPQGAATFTFRIKPKVKGGGKRLLRDAEQLQHAIKGTDYEGLDLLPADFSYRKLDIVLESERKPHRALARALGPLEREYDHVFLDCAPGLSQVSENIFAAADVVLVPTIPTVLSLRTLSRLLKYVREHEELGVRVQYFFAMVDRRRRLHREVTDWARTQELGFLETEIPYSSVVEQMSSRRKPLGAYAPRSAAGKSYQGLWEELRAQPEARPVTRRLSKDLAAFRPNGSA